VPPLLRAPEVDLRAPITREEFAGVVVLTYQNLSGTVVPVPPAESNPFTDTKDVYARMAYNIGLMVGTSATQFDPNTLLTREMAATALTRVDKLRTYPNWTFATDGDYPLSYIAPAPFVDHTYISSWAKEGVYFMAANGIIQGFPDGTFRPRNVTSDQELIGYATATREQAIIIALRMVENLR